MGAGGIRELTPTGQAVVELADASTIVVAVTDINDAPPPDIGLDDRSPRPLAVRPESGTLTAPAALVGASPEVQELFARLSALSQEQQRAEIRRMLLASHSDKGGPGDTATFMAVQMARNLPRNPQQQGPAQPAPQLMLMINRAFAARTFNAGPNFPVHATSAPQGGGRTLYSWTYT